VDFVPHSRAQRSGESQRGDNWSCHQLPPSVSPRYTRLDTSPARGLLAREESLEPRDREGLGMYRQIPCCREFRREFWKKSGSHVHFLPDNEARRFGESPALDAGKSGRGARSIALRCFAPLPPRDTRAGEESWGASRSRRILNVQTNSLPQAISQGILQKVGDRTMHFLPPQR
jgi:hypothetical protein